MNFDKKFPILGDYFLVKSLGTGLGIRDLDDIEFLFS